MLNTSRRRLQNVLKKSWRCLEDVFATPLEDVLKTSWIRLGKTSWRRFEDVWPRRIYWSLLRRLEDVFWRRMTKANIFVLIKMSWRCLLKMKTKDVFIKTNVCWGVSFYLKRGFAAGHSFYQMCWLVLEDPLEPFIFSYRVVFLSELLQLSILSGVIWNG